MYPAQSKSRNTHQYTPHTRQPRPDPHADVQWMPYKQFRPIGSHPNFKNAYAGRLGETLNPPQ